MNERRRHGSSGRGKGIFKALGWTVVVALLGGNLVMAMVNKEADDTPKGFLTPELLTGAAFWTTAGVSMLMSVLGLWWSSKAYAQSERSSLLWARRGYVFTLVGSIAFTMACFDGETFPRQWLAVLAAAVLAGQTVFFALVAFREMKRADGDGGGGRRSRGRGGESPASPAQQSAAAELADPTQ